MQIMLLLNWLLMVEDIPELYEQLFNAGTLSAMLMIIGAVKLIRNPLLENGKGFLAFVATFIVSISYGIIQFGFLSGLGWLYGLIIGLLTTGSFYLTKNVGKVLEVFMKLHKPGQKIDAVDLANFLRGNDKIVAGIWRVVRYLFFRK